jgi:hypothetical protein
MPAVRAGRGLDHQGLDQIGPGHDADQVPIAHDRKTANAPVLEDRDRGLEGGR